MSDQPTLKPCPCCAAPIADSGDHRYYTGSEARLAIICQGCGLMMTESIRETWSTSDAPVLAAKALLYERWNRRALNP